MRQLPPPPPFHYSDDIYFQYLQCDFHFTKTCNQVNCSETLMKGYFIDTLKGTYVIVCFNFKFIVRTFEKVFQMKMFFLRILLHMLDILVTFTYINMILFLIVTMEPFHFIKTHQKWRIFILNCGLNAGQRTHGMMINKCYISRTKMNLNFKCMH